MTEAEYIAASDYARVRALETLVAELSSPGVLMAGVPHDEWHLVRRLLAGWHARLAQLVDTR